MEDLTTSVRTPARRSATPYIVAFTLTVWFFIWDSRAHQADILRECASLWAVPDASSFYVGSGCIKLPVYPGLYEIRRAQNNDARK